MVILKYFLHLLELLEQVAEFIELLTTPLGLGAMVCLFSYQMLVLIGCDIPNATVLATVVALAFHSISNRPNF